MPSSRRCGIMKITSQDNIHQELTYTSEYINTHHSTNFYWDVKRISMNLVLNYNMCWVELLMLVASPEKRKVILCFKQELWSYVHHNVNLCSTKESVLYQSSIEIQSSWPLVSFVKNRQKFKTLTEISVWHHSPVEIRQPFIPWYSKHNAVKCLSINYLICSA